MSGSAMFVQPPNSIPIPMLADLDGQCYYASGGISRTPLMSPSPNGSYTTGQTIGSGVRSLANAARAVGNGSGIIYGITIADGSRNSGQVDILFFNQLPAASTFTDKTEAVLATADTPYLIGSLHVVDWTIYGATTGCSVGNAAGSGLFYQLGKAGSVVNTTLYAVAIARASLTFSASWYGFVKCLPD